MLLLFMLLIWLPLLIWLSKKFGYKNVWKGTVTILLLLFLIVSVIVAIK